MSAPYLGKGNLCGVAQVEIVAPPLWNVAVIKVAKGQTRPGRSMDTIGNRVDGMLGKHSARDFPMAHGDAVDVPRQLQCEVGHVEHAVRHTLHGLKAS